MFFFMDGGSISKFILHAENMETFFASLLELFMVEIEKKVQGMCNII